METIGPEAASTFKLRCDDDDGSHNEGGPHRECGDFCGDSRQLSVSLGSSLGLASELVKRLAGKRLMLSGATERYGRKSLAINGIQEVDGSIPFSSTNEIKA
jgi:hypothetical protein